MRKMQFAPKNGMPKYHEKPAGKTEWAYMLDAFVRDGILVMDFYCRVKNRWKAMWRTLLSEKEYANYDYTEEAWNTKNIECQQADSADWNGRYTLDWEMDFKIADTSRRAAEEYIKATGGYIYKSLRDTVKAKERWQREDKRERAEERRVIRIQEKMAELPEPPKDFEKNILETTFKNDHILYFGKNGAFCSRCGRTVTVGEKQHGESGKCPKCRKQVIFKNTRYIKGHVEDKEVLYIQPNKEETVLRYFKCALHSTSQSRERLEITESVRTYHTENMNYYKKRYIHYYNYDGDFWHDKMNTYHPVAYGNNTCLYTGNMEEVREIISKTTSDILESLGSEGQKARIKDILGGYSESTLLLYEKLYKAKLKKLAMECIKGYYGFDIDKKQRELKKMLKISKPMLKYMAEKNGGRKTLEILQDAFENPRGLSDEKIFCLAAAGISVSGLAEISEKNKIIKTFHYLEKAKGYKNLEKTYSHYRDYIAMVSSMGYDLSNGTVRYPKDLRQAHDRAVAMFYEGETDKHKREAIKKYPNITMQEVELNERYSYQTKKYVISAPHSAADIVEEGRSLHHCVGGDVYLQKHNNGKSFILFLRKTGEPNKSYYTIEIDPKTDKILQYYGMNDRKPDKESVDAFLKRWKAYLKKKQETEHNMPQPAAG